MAIDFKKIFSKVLNVTGQVLTQTVIQEASKQKKVQEQVAIEKTKIGKDVLWNVFPIVLVGGALYMLIKGFK